MTRQEDSSNGVTRTESAVVPSASFASAADAEGEEI